jgi:hypothetical protein
MATPSPEVAQKTTADDRFYYWLIATCAFRLSSKPIDPSCEVADTTVRTDLEFTKAKLRKASTMRATDSIFISDVDKHMLQVCTYMHPRVSVASFYNRLNSGSLSTELSSTNNWAKMSQTTTTHATTPTRTMIETYNPAELRAAVAINTDGLPVFKPSPIRVDTTPIKLIDGHAYLMCKRCNRRLLFGRFHYKDIAMHRHPTCIECLEKNIKPPRPFVPRRICLSNKGILNLFCKPCGNYFPAHLCQTSRIWTRRSICPKCQEKESARHKEFITSRKHAFVYTYLRQCQICQCHSKTRICGYCRTGRAPVAGDAVPGMHSVFRKTNAAAMFAAVALQCSVAAKTHVASKQHKLAETSDNT